MDQLDLGAYKATEIDDVIDNIKPAKCLVVFDQDTTLHAFKLCHFSGSVKKEQIPERFEPVREIVRSAAVAFYTGVQRPSTLRGIACSAINMIEWTDTHTSIDALADGESYREALKVYVDHLNDRYARGDIVEHTTATNTANCMQIGTWAFGLSNEYMLEHVKRVKRNTRALENSTEPPDQSTIKESYSLNKRLFEELSSFLTNKRDYPHQITLPQEKLWVLPAKSWGATEEILLTLPAWGKSKVWNYKTGKLYTEQEAMTFRTSPSETRKYRSREKINLEKRELVLANTEYSKPRITISQWAHDAYLSIFAAITNANETSVRNFTWDDSLVFRECIFPKSPKLRTVKYRANGMDVVFEIRANGIALFERFLNFRKYILRGREHKYLFVTLSREGEISQLAAGTLRRHYSRIRAQLYPGFKGVGYREWRANAGTVAFDIAGATTASQILQTSVKSVLRNYSKGTIENWERDLTAYFNAFAEEFGVYKARRIPIGHCNGDGIPENLDKNPAMRPNCTNFEGCLHCNKYSLHIDEEDIRKILSMQYVILQTEHTAASKEKFNYAFKSTLSKIEWILSEVSNTSREAKELVDQTRTQVFEEEDITEYWQAKLNMLIEMGVI